MQQITTQSCNTNRALIFKYKKYNISFHDGKRATPYNYNYGVQDAYTGADFAHNEDSDGKNVKGSYTVQLPDGRRQTVDYIANDFSGYTANVKYSGEAEYPSKYGPAITFKPNSYIPVYH
ncbi:cuticle protein 18.6-like [Macrobrachium rosenbergii]|uniref:cuticle protein 18.6-like n=1 Tax=Macrobrachium rosenbergii TaxID=79674 RepID=UPI0034D54252